MLYRAFLLLSTSFFLAMDGTMAQTGGVSGYDTGGANAVITTTGSPPTSFLDVNFFHDEVPSTGSYQNSYYYAGCVNALLDTPATTGLTNVNTRTPSGSLGIPYVSTVSGEPSATCGIADNLACTVKMTYQFNLQTLSGITDPFVKSGDGRTGSPFQVKFCLRHSLFDGATIASTERGYKEADVTVTWTTENGFQGTVTTTENGPGNGNVDIGAVTAQAQICSDSTPANIPTVYNQGEKIQICLWASVTAPTPTPASVVIVEVNELRFWIDNPLSPNVNNVYNPGEVTQVGVTNNALVGTTTLIPTDVIGTGSGQGGTCDQSFATYISGASNPGNGKSGCVLTTFLSNSFFQSSPTSVKYAGSVTIQFANGIRRDLQLKDGETFAKQFGSEVTTLSRDTGDDSCECGGFFFLFCLVMCFISSVLG